MRGASLRKCSPSIDVHQGWPSAGRTSSASHTASIFFFLSMGFPTPPCSLPAGRADLGIGRFEVTAPRWSVGSPLTRLAVPMLSAVSFFHLHGWPKVLGVLGTGRWGCVAIACDPWCWDGVYVSRWPHNHGTRNVSFHPPFSVQSDTSHKLTFDL